MESILADFDPSMRRLLAFLDLAPAGGPSPLLVARLRQVLLKGPRSHVREHAGTDAVMPSVSIPTTADELVDVDGGPWSTLFPFNQRPVLCDIPIQSFSIG